MLDSMKKPRMKESNLDLHAGSLVTSSHGKDAEFYSTKKNSIHQHAGIGCDTSLIVGTIFNLAKVNTAHCNLQPPSLFWTASRRLDSLAYIRKHN